MTPDTLGEIRPTTAELCRIAVAIDAAASLLHLACMFPHRPENVSPGRLRLIRDTLEDGARDMAALVGPEVER